MSLRTLITSSSHTASLRSALYIRAPIGTQIHRFSGSAFALDHKSYSVDEFSRFLESKSPTQTFNLSVRQPSESSKQGDEAVGYSVTVEAIQKSLNEIEDKESDRFLVEGNNEIVYMSKTEVKPKFEVKLQKLTQQKSEAGMERNMEWSAKDQKVNETTDKPGSQPIS